MGGILHHQPQHHHHHHPHNHHHLRHTPGKHSCRLPPSACLQPAGCSGEEEDEGGGRGGKDDDGDDIDGDEGGSDVIIFSPELVVGESPADVVSRSGCPSQFQPEMEIMMKVWKYKI